jgi:hypothetical protein
MGVFSSAEKAKEATKQFVVEIYDWANQEECKEFKWKDHETHRSLGEIFDTTNITHYDNSYFLIEEFELDVLK